ncbi:histidine phosphatase family protein [Nocardia shimofusensis]|uniref:histidine phosphatase family protein n=1 Tax=Nocardia shimofusensis TaxID=228596 RepID=UPI0008306923|nr:histidine phosphatase family protein [Nocardia shimofusensis]
MTTPGTVGKLILVRHGETEGNVARLLDTRVPGLPLTERGAAQAKTFGSRLTAAPTVLLSSVALRARQTASYIEEVTGVPATALEDVHEVQAGDLEGLADDHAHRTFQRIYGSWHQGDLDIAVPGGESGADVLSRFLPVIEDLRDRYLDPLTHTGDVLLVNHGAAMRLVARTLAGIAPPFATTNRLDNTETIELVPRADGSWECVRWGQFVPPFDYAKVTSAQPTMG